MKSSDPGNRTRHGLDKLGVLTVAFLLMFLKEHMSFFLIKN